MAKLWEVEINVRYTVEVEADTADEAEDYAYDDFMNDKDFWDIDFETYLIDEENADEDSDEDEIDDRSLVN